MPVATRTQITEDDLRRRPAGHPRVRFSLESNRLRSITDRARGDHVNGIQPIKQAFAEGADGDAFVQHRAGACDEPSTTRWFTCCVQPSERLDQPILHDWRHLFDIGQQQGAVTDRVEDIGTRLRECRCMDR